MVCFSFNYHIWAFFVIWIYDIIIYILIKGYMCARYWNIWRLDLHRCNPWPALAAVGWGVLAQVQPKPSQAWAAGRTTIVPMSQPGPDSCLPGWVCTGRSGLQAGTRVKFELYLEYHSCMLYW